MAVQTAKLLGVTAAAQRPTLWTTGPGCSWSASVCGAGLLPLQPFGLGWTGIHSSTTVHSEGRAASDASAAAVGSDGSANVPATGPDGFSVLYQGLFAQPHKRLKYASLLNTFASFAAAPLIISYSAASPVARVAVVVSLVAFATITTGGLHWFTKPYVHQLLYNSKTDMAKVQTLSFFGGKRWAEFSVSAVQQPAGYHPLASFQVHGKTYYIDRGNFEHAELLERLVPGKHTQAEESEASDEHKESEASDEHEPQDQRSQPGSGKS